MLRTSSAIIVVVGLSVTTLPTAGPAGIPGGNDVLTKKVNEKVARCSYLCIVAGLGEKSITAIPVGLVDGQVFPVDEALVGTKVPPGGTELDDRYLLSDVQKGDIIRIDCRVVGGEPTVEVISILRRPGGRVPPGYMRVTGPAESNYRHHERMNALQDRDEKGIPLPPKYRMSEGPQPLPPLPGN